MATEQNVPIDFNHMGLMLGVPPDRADQPGRFVLFENMESFRDGFIQNRLGTKERATNLGAAPNQLPAPIHSMGYLLQAVDASGFFEYYGIGTDLYAVDNSDTVIDASDIVLPPDHIRFSGNPMTMDSYRINEALLPHAIVFDKNKRVKMDGLEAEHFGIPGPTYAASAATNGAGNLTGDYDWRYQYRVEKTQSVSPLSPVMSANLTAAANKVNVTVRQPNDEQITHIDLYRRGGTQPSAWYFVNSTKAMAFAGLQVIEDNVADDALGDSVASNQIEFSNVLHPPTSTRKTENNGAAYTDYSTAAADSDSSTHVDLSSIDNVASDWFVIGADLVFRKIAIGMDSTGTGSPNPASVNTNPSVLTVQYWDGSAWQAVSRLIDGTSVAGATFGKNGLLTYDFPSDWVRSTIDGVAAYYVKLTFSAGLSGTVLLDGIRVSAMEFDATTFALHADRLWTDDEQNPDRVWFSQRFRVEEFRDTSYIIVGKGGDRVRRLVSLDDQMFAFTDNTIYRVIGSGQELLGGGSDFQAIATGAEHGLYARYAITKGAGRIYYRSYDGIYAFGGSGIQKLSDPWIDPLFRGFDAGTDPSQKAVLNTFNGLDHERLAYFNNKLYWSYKKTDGVVQELTYDFLSQRWAMSDRKPVAYLPIDYQGRIFSAHNDQYIYLRETGNSDVLGASISPIVMRWQTGYYDFGAPEQDKNFIELVIDVDCGGATLDVTIRIDNGDFVATSRITGNGRQRHWMPINQGIGVFGKNIAISLEGTNTSNASTRVRFYKLTYNFWTEPRELNATSWDWNDYGYKDRKYLKQLIIDLDTQGAAADVSVFIDGATTAAHTFASVQTTTKQRVVLSLPTDFEATIAKVLVKSLQDEWEVKAYSHYFEFLVNGLMVGRTQTDWADQGYPGDKRFRQLMLQIDTRGMAVQCGIEVDGEIVETFEVNTSGRRWITHSLPANTIGKLERLVFNR